MNLKKKLILFCLLLMASASPALAQFEGTEEIDRIGKPDSPEFKVNRDLKNEFAGYINRYSTSDNKFFETDVSTWPVDSMYVCWRKLYDRAPFANKSLYVRGAAMLDSMSLHANKSDAERLIYFQDLMQSYEDRARRNDSLNSFEKEDRLKSTRSAIMVKQADVYWHTAPKVKGSGYTPENAYNKYVNAFEELRNETNAASTEIAPAYLVNYFKACRELYETDSTHTKYLEQFLTDYTNCLESCDKMMAAYEDNDKTQWKNYAGAYNIIQQQYDSSKAGTKENLERFYKVRIENIKDNHSALNNAIKLMMGNQSLLSSDIYFKACHYAYDIEPDFQNCIGMANEAKIKDQKDSALFYFKKADELSKSPTDHFNAKKMMGQAMASEKAPVFPLTKNQQDSLRAVNKEELARLIREHNDKVESWKIRQKIAADKMQEAINDSKQANILGQYIAPVYYFMAQCYRKAETMESLDKAEHCLEMAIQVYPLFGSTDTRMQAEYNNIDKTRAKVEDAERKRAAEMADKARQDRAKAAYDAYVAKQKAEEDFWGGKK